MLVRTDHLTLLPNIAVTQVMRTVMVESKLSVNLYLNCLVPFEVRVRGGECQLEPWTNRGQQRLSSRRLQRGFPALTCYVCCVVFLAKVRTHPSFA